LAGIEASPRTAVGDVTGATQVLRFEPAFHCLLREGCRL